MKVILISVNDRPECILALHHSFVLGQQTQSSVIGCHISSHTNPPDETIESIITPDSYDLAWEATLKEKSTDDDPVNVQKLFNSMAEQYNYALSKKHKNIPTALCLKK